jgi:hypothetical protein
MSTSWKIIFDTGKTPPGTDEEEVDINTPGPIFDDTNGFIDRDTSLKWGEV